MGKEKKDKKDRKPKDYDLPDVPKVLKGEVKPLSQQPLMMRKDYGAPEDAAMTKNIPIEDVEDKVKEPGKGMKPPMPLAMPPATGPMDYDDPIPGGCGCDNAPSCGCGPKPLPMPPENPAVSEEVVMPPDEDGGVITILVCPDCGTEGPFDMEPPPGIKPETRKLKCARCKTTIPLNLISKTASNKYEVKVSHCMDSEFKTIKKIVKSSEMESKDADRVVSALDKIYKKYLELEKHMKSCGS